MVHSSRWLLLVGLLVIVGLPVAGYLARRTDGPRCALDGTALNPLYAVEIVDHQGARHEFCCLRCAEIWLSHQREAVQKIIVTDETSGDKMDATAAWYVRSAVVTTPTTGNRIHSFRTRAEAEKHAAACSGVVLPDDEKPFH